MVRVSALSIVLAAASTGSCLAFVPAPVMRLSPGHTPSMSLKGTGKSSAPLSKVAKTVGKILFSKPGANKQGGNNGGGMIGGGNGNSHNDGFVFEDDDDSSAVMMLGVLGALKDGAGDAWDAYNGALAENPILVKACTSLVGFSIGDFLAQKSTSKEGFSYERLARMAAFGFLFHGTISHFFYNALDGALPGTAPFTIVQKVFIDQVLWAPIFTLIFFTWIGVTSGSSPNEIVTKIKNDLVQGVVGSWTVWPLAHAINFKYIPTSQRLLYINSIQIFYNVFLSIIGSK